MWKEYYTDFCENFPDAPLLAQLWYPTVAWLTIPIIIWWRVDVAIFLVKWKGGKDASL